jgi:starch-binding outer membrane protein, SusD/RagB family
MPMTSTAAVTICPRPRPRARTRSTLASLLAFLLAGGAAACSPDKLLGNQQLPPDVPDPAQTHTPAGALAAYNGAIVQLRTAFGGDANSFVPLGGLLTDELRSGDLGQIGSMSDPLLIDSRFMPEDPGIGNDTFTPTQVMLLYSLLQRTRGQAREARGALQAYAPNSAALVGHLDAVEGYADVMLADLFCSGVPLSTLDYGGDFTYASGSSTEEVYAHAVALLDSALTLATDSDRVMNLARVGKGRALLDLGQYAEAAAAVAGVPDEFRYTFDFSTTLSPGRSGSTTNWSFVYPDFGGSLTGSTVLSVTMVDGEGQNGLPYLTSGDPRSAWVNNGTNDYGLALTRPTRYAADGSTEIVLASGIEARLIEAEAALQAGNQSWLVALNALRTDGTFTTSPPDEAGHVDTLWTAGRGGVAGLRPLEDPVAPDARVTLLFQERAYWLFLTGHRQGDLRRLIRQYGRQADSIYPTGPYPGAYNSYGTDVTAPIPGAERVRNPRFTGCRNREA